ncbi:hypothetical protein TNCV_4369321 [Trichonephila clavipes]|nr:hypothetical protein TNCV_4369321 [Trichonephila clavipes]
MASIRKYIAKDCKTVHCGALDFAKKIAGLISHLNGLKWDIPNLDEEDLRDFKRNDGKLVWQYFCTFGRRFAKNVKYSPKVWVLTEDNFENRLHALMQETGYHKKNFGKKDLFFFCAQILVIASWFIKNNIQNLMDIVIDVVYNLTLRMFKSTPMYGSSW